jgi:hypothetical protein
MRLATLAAVMLLLSWRAPQGQAQDTRPPRQETRARLVLVSFNLGLGNPPVGDTNGDILFPPDPYVTFNAALDAVVGEHKPYRGGIVSINGTIVDDATGFTRGTFETRGRLGEAVLAGRLTGQPSGIAPCWTVQSVLTNARTGEVLDSLTQEIDYIAPR